MLKDPMALDYNVLVFTHFYAMAIFQFAFTTIFGWSIVFSMDYPSPFTKEPEKHVALLTEYEI